MDLNAKDSFYPQFENCNSSSLGMESGARKDNQEVYVEAERGVPAQFGHGESADNTSNAIVASRGSNCVAKIRVSVYVTLASRLV